MDVIDDGPPGSPRSVSLAIVTGGVHNGAVERLSGPLTEPTDVSSTIASLHERLDLHFQELASSRQRLPGQPRVYAIEHGLSTGDLSVLRDVVEARISRSRPPRGHWLPFIVYATEVGYRYEGDEYWPTLEARAPGWEEKVGRQYVKTRFQKFQQVYRGATPYGRWASHFTIICWPITHAILPTDLQRHLARVLYEYRGRLTGELLDSPAHLGRVLAARTLGTSKRFQQFAENAELLGHVAAALLVGHEDAQTIDALTLGRIIDDLSERRQARAWLSDARSSANHIRLQGASRAPQSGQRPTGGSVEPELYRPTSPVAFSVHPEDAGWHLRLRVPDFTPLFARHPDLSDQVALVRCRVSGTSGRPRPRGWLLYPGQQVTLDKWPGHDTVVFELERASSQASDLFANEARTPQYQSWLFRIGPDGTGCLVRSGSVRAGIRYLLMGPNLRTPPVGWIKEQPTACDGAIALLIQMPEKIDSRIAEAVRDLGCGVETSVEVAPVGLVAAAWDGDGFGEWLVGDDPMLRLSTTQAVTDCTATLNGVERAVLSWEESVDNSVVLALSGLSEGWHVLGLSFLVPEGTDPIPDLQIDIHMRGADPGRPGGTFRDPLRLRVTPQRASLEDVWDGRAVVEADGLYGAHTKLKVMLKDANGSTTANHTLRVALPVASADWKAFRTHVRSRAGFEKAYDDATQLEFVLGDDELGTVSVLLERELEALRWGFRRVRNRTVLRLYNAADTGATPEIMRYPFTTPENGEVVAVESSDFDDPDGGLFVAKLAGHQARAILPPTVRDFQDLRSVRSKVQLSRRQRNPTSLMTLVELADRWSRSRSPGDLLAHDRRSAIVAEINSEIGSLVGGCGKWGSLERRHADGVTLSIEDLAAGLDKPSHWTDFRRRIATLASSPDQLVDPPVERFSALIGDSPLAEAPAHVIRSSYARSMAARLPGAQFKRGGLWLAELLLRLASSPGSLISWSSSPSDLDFNEVLEHPITFRAARMLAIVSRQEEQVWEWE